jgi:hypothetical protein
LFNTRRKIPPYESSETLVTDCSLDRIALLPIAMATDSS